MTYHIRANPEAWSLHSELQPKDGRVWYPCLSDWFFAYEGFVFLGFFDEFLRRRNFESHHTRMVFNVRFTFRRGKDGQFHDTTSLAQNISTIYPYFDASIGNKRSEQHDTYWVVIRKMSGYNVKVCILLRLCHGLAWTLPLKWLDDNVMNTKSLQREVQRLERIIVPFMVSPDDAGKIKASRSPSAETRYATASPGKYHRHEWKSCVFRYWED